MYALTLFYTVFAYAAIAIFIIGFMARILKYATTPAPLKIALTPAPATSTGVTYRMIQEAGLFKFDRFYNSDIPVAESGDQKQDQVDTNRVDLPCLWSTW